MKGEKPLTADCGDLLNQESDVLNDSKIYLTGIQEALDNLINFQGKLEPARVKEIAGHLEESVVKYADLATSAGEKSLKTTKFAHQFRNDLQVVYDFFKNFSNYETDTKHQIAVQEAAVRLLREVDLRIKEIK